MPFSKNSFKSFVDVLIIVFVHDYNVFTYDVCGFMTAHTIMGRKFEKKLKTNTVFFILPFNTMLDAKDKVLKAILYKVLFWLLLVRTIAKI